MEPTRPMMVTPSRTLLTTRVSASRIRVTSVVKRVASWAGGSRSTWDRSARARWTNIRSCSSRMTSSTSCCTITVWPYCATDLAAVTRMTMTGT